MIAGCTALILAGGDSRRMGQDKAALLLEGRSLLEHVTATMQAVFPEVLVSVRRPRPGLGLRQVCDETGDDGPLAGLASGLAQARTPWVFAVACDMPFVTPVVIERLASVRAGHHAVVPVVGGYPQPLAAFYATSALDVIRMGMAQGDRSLRRMLQRLNVRYVNEDELREADPALRSFFDLDTPQDLEAARTR